MILGMTSLGEGRMPTRNHLQRWGSHAAGGCIGGLLTAGALLLVAAPARTLIPLPARVAVCLSLILVSGVLTSRPAHRKSHRVQVPATWVRRYGANLSGAFLGYGVVLGSSACSHTYPMQSRTGSLLLERWSPLRWWVLPLVQRSGSSLSSAAGAVAFLDTHRSLTRFVQIDPVATAMEVCERHPLLGAYGHYLASEPIDDKQIHPRVVVCAPKVPMFDRR